MPKKPDGHVKLRQCGSKLRSLQLDDEDTFAEFAQLSPTIDLTNQQVQAETYLQWAERALDEFQKAEDAYEIVLAQMYDESEDVPQQIADKQEEYRSHHRKLKRWYFDRKNNMGKLDRVDKASSYASIVSRRSQRSRGNSPALGRSTGRSSPREAMSHEAASRIFRNMPTLQAYQDPSDYRGPRASRSPPFFNESRYSRDMSPSVFVRYPPRRTATTANVAGRPTYNQNDVPVQQVSVQPMPVQSHSQRNLIKLPRPEMPKFDGDILKFKPFWDRFQHLVEASDYPEESKLDYLLQCLRGEALTLVENVAMSAEGYRVAKRLLLERYGNQTVAREDIQGKLSRLTPPKADAAQLSKFYSTLENYLGAFESVGGDPDSNHFISLILDKLPVSVTMTLERSKGLSENWTVRRLRQALREEVAIRETAVRRTGHRDANFDEERPQRNDAYRNPPQRKPWSNRVHSTAETMVTSDKGGRAGPYPSGCAFCGGNHRPWECGKYKTVAERRAQMGRRCNVCLSPDHLKRDCCSKRSCYYCKKVADHNSSLCYKEFGFPNGKRELAHVTNDNGQQNGPIWPAVAYERRSDADTHPEVVFWSRRPDTCGPSNWPMTEGRTDSQSVQQDPRINLPQPARRPELGNLADDEHTVMKTALVPVAADPRLATMTVRVFLDSGSSRTYVTERLASTLGLIPENSKMLAVSRFGSDCDPHMITVKTATLFARTIGGKSRELNVSVTPKIMSSMNRTAIPSDLIARIPEDIRLADTPLSRTTMVEIDMMIGNDYYDEVMTGSRIELAPGFYLVSSIFGWVFSGRLLDGPNEHLDIVAFAQATVVSQRDEEVLMHVSDGYPKEPPLEDLWNLESIGIRDNPDSAADESAIKQFNRTVRFEDGRYQVTWPWQCNADELEPNYDAALSRLKSTINRVRKTDGLIERYDAVIKDQLQKEVIEEVPPDQVENTPNKVHYLPHREVLTPQKATTKLRVVYDASAKPAPNKPSLNECLYRGLVFMTSLVTLLMRFMMHPIAIVADIEKAFLQVGLQPQERDVTRFLWVRDISRPVTTANLVIYRFTRVTFGMKPSPFLLGATIVHHLRRSLLEIARVIEENLYVDNVIHGATSKESALQFYRDSKQIFREAGMNLREFASNCKPLLDSLPPEDRVKDEVVKILGIKWKPDDDTIWINIPDRFADVKTKQGVMESLFKVFDPLGFLQPIGIRSRILLQKICKHKFNWNDKLPEEFITEYNSIAADYKAMSNVKWNRYLGFEVNENSRLLCFCDASAAAYAAVIYIQSAKANGQWQSRLFFAKARVSPLKQVTMPRLELLAVLLGTRCVRFIRDELAFVGKTVVFTDSMCCLHWIRSNKVHGRFVENRLREIRELPDVEYRYVSSSDNPADLPSRGLKAEGIGDFWWYGPQWAQMNEADWPENLPDKEETAVVMELEEESCLADAAVTPWSPFGIDASRYSSKAKLIRVTAWCQRFVNRLRRGKAEQHESLTRHEMSDAEERWTKFTQAEGFPDLLKCIASNRKHALFHQLGAFMDSKGIIRCRGRLANIAADEEARFPALLPAAHPFTTVVVKESHAASLHGGIALTLTTIRRRYWIPKGKPTISRILKRCQICRKNEGRGFSRPSMPDLPSYRVQRENPFTSVGLDYFGPLYVRHGKTPEGITTKVWACLLTCLVTRAVHLELVRDCSTDEFLLALRRFCARRGKPRIIVSDNAATFRKAERQLTQEGRAIEWKFTTPLSPWKVGVFERMVKTVKSSLKKTIGRALLSHDQLNTVLLEVENVVNSRPLTKLECEPDVVPLTPNDLLGVRSLTDETYAEEEFQDTSSERVRQLAKKQCNVLNQFWILWQKSYLQELREVQKAHHKDPIGSVQRPPKVGEIVLVQEGRLPRGKWKMAKVIDLIKSSDQKIRAVKVQYPDKTKVLRPPNLLYPLEFDFETKLEGNATERYGRKDKLYEAEPSQPQRTKRLAGIECMRKIKALKEQDAI